MEFRCSAVAVWGAFDKSVHSVVWIKVLWRLPVDYAVPQGSRKFFMTKMKNAHGLGAHGRRIHAKTEIYSDSPFSRAAPPLLPLLPSFVSLRYLLASRKILEVFSSLTATSKLMSFSCFSFQEAESCWGPCSPSSLAVWCFPFKLVRIAERWCLAVRPKDTHRPSTGNNRRHAHV